jgi:hypothetical protein
VARNRDIGSWLDKVSNPKGGSNRIKFLNKPPLLVKKVFILIKKTAQ